MGNFNINLMKTGNHEPTADFYDTMITKRFTPMINNPIRITPFNETLRDNFLINFC